MKRLAIGLLRGAAALGIAYAFLIVLMTSIAQQQVIVALAQVDTKLDYSSAYARDRQLDARQTEVETRTETERKLAEAHAAEEFSLREAQADADDAWLELRAAARTAQSRGSCGEPASRTDADLWVWATQCLGSGEPAPRDRALLEGVVGKAPNASTLERDRQAQSRKADHAYNELQAERALLKLAQDDVQEGQVLRGAFDEMDVLTQSWPGGALLAQFSPTLLQIIAAFVSGLFGALLITLVLTVYPRSAVEFTAGKGLEARILLGGLISIGVFIVLGGGVAILGSNPGGEAGPSNVMTFCAVGVLAGMFSDRVAAWLSAKAETFFAKPPPA